MQPPASRLTCTIPVLTPRAAQLLLCCVCAALLPPSPPTAPRDSASPCFNPGLVLTLLGCRGGHSRVPTSPVGGVIAGSLLDPAMPLESLGAHADPGTVDQIILGGPCNRIGPPHVVASASQGSCLHHTGCGVGVGGRQWQCCCVQLMGRLVHFWAVTDWTHSDNKMQRPVLPGLLPAAANPYVPLPAPFVRGRAFLIVHHGGCAGEVTCLL